MTLKSIVEGIGGTLAGTITDAMPDTAELRRPVLSSLDLAERQWANADVTEQPDWFSEAKGFVAFSPTLANGAPLTIDGQTRVFVPADRFADYLQAMRTAIHNGVFDDEIKGGLNGSPNVSGLAKVTMPEARSGSYDDIRRAQREELLTRRRDPIADAG